MATQRQKARKNSQIIVILAVLAIAAAAVFLAPRWLAKSDKADRYTVTIPLVETHLKASNGNEYDVHAMFAVRLDTKARSTLTASRLHQALIDIMAHANVDAIIAPEGVAYVGSFATENLNASLTVYNNTEVLVTDLYVGERRILSDDPSQEVDIADGLIHGVD